MARDNVFDPVEYIIVPPCAVPLVGSLLLSRPCLTKSQYSRIDSASRYAKAERYWKKSVLRERKNELQDEKERKRQKGRYTQRLPKPAGSPCRRCFLTQHNVTTIVLKLAAVGYSAAAFPCKASRMKPRQRRVAAGAAQTSPYPDRPLTALGRRPFLPSSLRPGPLPTTSYIHLLYALYPTALRCHPLSLVVPLPSLRATSYILSHCAPSLSVTTRAILTF